MPPPPHTHTHSAHNVFFLTSADIKPLCDQQWRKMNMNIFILFETSLITIDKIQIASGAQPKGKGMPYCSPKKWKFKKKYRFCRHDNSKRFMWFTLQPKSVTEFRYRLYAYIHAQDCRISVDFDNNACHTTDVSVMEIKILLPTYLIK